MFLGRQESTSLIRTSRLRIQTFPKKLDISGSIFRVVLLENEPSPQSAVFSSYSVFTSIHLSVNFDQLPVPCWKKAIAHHPTTTMFQGDCVFRVTWNVFGCMVCFI